MLSLDAAWSHIVQHVLPGQPLLVNLAEGLGCSLAEDIVSNTDSPPFDKSMMDGFGIQSDAFSRGRRQFRIAGELTAGQSRTAPLGQGDAIWIMTGAPIPPGVDAVVRIEDCRVEGDVVHLNSATVPCGLNIVRRGESMRIGEALLPAGRILRAQEIGLLAELGRAQVIVRRKPRIAVLATGNELVPVDATPGSGQIRNTNEPMLCAQIRQAGCEAVGLGIARDNVDSLQAGIQEGLQADILCLSGGVSAGKLDLVPQELERAGVQSVFHKVELRPGKPVWFGVKPGPAPCYVFGLPGNPVSSQVCFELFVRTAIRRLLGSLKARPDFKRARLEADFHSSSDRPTFFPAKIRYDGVTRIVTTTNWQGSFDLRATVDANGLAFFEENRLFQAGEEVPVLALGLSSS